MSKGNQLRARIIDAAECTEDVYRLRSIVRTAADIVASLTESLEEAKTLLNKSECLMSAQNSLIELMKITHNLTEKPTNVDNTAAATRRGR